MSEPLTRVISDLMNRGFKGRMLAHAYSDIVDQKLSKVFYESAEGEDLLLLATGGYGRRELAPYSDIDIMFYTDRKGGSMVAERILYRLWDEKLDISHAFRNSKDCLEEAFSDIRTRTALLEARYIAGSRRLYEKYQNEVYPVISQRKQGQFVAEKLREIHERHRSAGDSVYLLEPHLKEGDGGLRDLHVIFWLSKVLYKVTDIEELNILFSQNDLKRLVSAYDFMIQARYCLHLESRRRNDILSFEYQKAVAECLGFRESRKFSGVERMMRYYYLKARIIKDLSRSIMESCSRKYAPVLRDFTRKKINDDFSIAGGRLIAEKKELFYGRPEKIMEAFLHFAKTGRRFSSLLRENIKENLMRINIRSRNNPVIVQCFMDILNSERVYETLREMNDIGVLARFLPEFGALHSLVVHEPYHMYTVDEHSLFAIRNLEMLRRTTVKSLESLRYIIQSIDRHDVLFLSLLLHDIGKAAGRRHEEEGYKKIKSIMERLNMSHEKRHRIEFLVRNHVLMSRIAMTRETDDPEVIASFADSVGDAENLSAIYLLTYADMSAVNPDFWNPWKASLLMTLYERTAKYLSGLEDSGMMHNPEDIFPGQPEMHRELERFISTMPERYLLSTTSQKLKADFLTYLRSLECGVSVRIETISDGITELTVCAADFPGLFARVAGFLALKRLNIVHGRVYTGKTGIVIDKISLSNWQDIWWSGLEKEIVSGLEDVLKNRKDLNISKMFRDRNGIFSCFAEIDNETSDSYSVIEIFSPDRLGLLYDISSMLHVKGFDIVSARINTERGLAQDVFSVHQNGAKLGSEAIAATLGDLWDILTS